MYYKTADERGVQLNEAFTIISNVTERDGVELSRTEGTGYGYKLVREGNQIRAIGSDESRYFHPISLKAWGHQTLQSDFVQKLPNPKRALNAFLSDVEAMYVGGAGRIYMLSRVTNGNQELLEVSPLSNSIQLVQQDHRISFVAQGSTPARVFELDNSVFNSVPRDTQWSIGFSEKSTGSILLANETRTLLTLIEREKNGGILFTNIVIADALFKLKEGKYKYAFLHEDYTVNTSFLMPTRNFACAELTQAYYDRQREAGIEMASSIILGIIQSYTNYSSTTMSGHAYSYQAGDLYVASGQATTYDYSYIGDRAEDVLRTVVQGGKSTSDIKRVMAQYDCVIP